MICGIDEAGRGPVLGPLVVAAVAGPSMELFAGMGCRDSKKLTPDRRRALDRQIRKHPEIQVAVRVLDPGHLDAGMAKQSLNKVELEAFRELARELPGDPVYADAADVNAGRFGRSIAAGLRWKRKVVSEHKADDTYPVVGAASIVAKVARDAAVAKLARRLERQLPMKLGSGYCHDERTQAFMAEWVKRFGGLPEGTRLRWKTATNLMAPRAVPLDVFGPADAGAGEV